MGNERLQAVQERARPREGKTGSAHQQKLVEGGAESLGSRGTDGRQGNEDVGDVISGGPGQGQVNSQAVGSGEGHADFVRASSSGSMVGENNLVSYWVGGDKQRKRGGGSSEGGRRNNGRKLCRKEGGSALAGGERGGQGAGDAALLAHVMAKDQAIGQVTSSMEQSGDECLQEGGARRGGGGGGGNEGGRERGHGGNMEGGVPEREGKQVGLAATVSYWTTAGSRDSGPSPAKAHNLIGAQAHNLISASRKHEGGGCGKGGTVRQVLGLTQVSPYIPSNPDTRGRNES